jgi:hypothetical protein
VQLRDRGHVLADGLLAVTGIDEALHDRRARRELCLLDLDHREGTERGRRANGRRDFEADIDRDALKSSPINIMRR